MKLFYHDVETSSNKSLKAFVISDIHYYSLKDNYKLNAIIKELDKFDYDMIYLLGDIIDATNVLDNKEAFESLLLFFKILGNYAPTYIAFGSHDLAYFKSKHDNPWLNDTRFKEELSNLSFKYPNLILDDNKFLELPNDDDIVIINPDILDFKDEFDDTKLDKKNYLYLKNSNPHKTTTLLCHYPNSLFILNKYGLLDNIDLGIVGHNHNGMTQFKVFPLESFLNLIGQDNRGLATPARSFNLEKTKYLRGEVSLNNQTNLIITPAITSLASLTGLSTFDKLFYKGSNVINYTNDEIKRKIK